MYDVTLSVFHPGIRRAAVEMINDVVLITIIKTRLCAVDATRFFSQQ